MYSTKKKEKEKRTKRMKIRACVKEEKVSNNFEMLVIERNNFTV